MTDEAQEPRRAIRVRLSGREPIAHPLGAVLIDAARRLAARGLAPPGTATLALRAGRTVLTNAGDTDLQSITMADLVEVADYDPIERVLLAVGPREPDRSAALLWLILRHREEVGAAILLPIAVTHATPDAAATATGQREAIHDPLEAAKTVLLALRDKPVVIAAGIGVVATGAGVPGAERNLMSELARMHPRRFGGDLHANPEEATPRKRRNGGPPVQ